VNRRRIGAGVGLGLGVIVAAPGAAQADDFRVTNLNDEGEGSLREAIDHANFTLGADRVIFASKLSGRIELAGEDLDIYLSDVEIIGPGARRLTVDANGDSRVFSLYGAPSFGLPPIDVSISGLTLTGGNAFTEGGGGIGAFGDVDLRVAATTISGNVADGGGGIYSYDDGYNGSLVVERSTISDNEADDGFGGGVNTFKVDTSIRNSTVSGNTTEGRGGGVYVGADAPAEILNSTVFGNSANASSGGGGLAEATPGATIRGSIIAGNVDGNLGAPDVDGGPWTTSFSLIGDSSGADIVNAGGNRLDANLLLSGLRDNGGLTNTHAIRRGPVKSKIPKGQTPKSDQRGAPRKGKGDIGAYELVRCRGVTVNRVGTTGRDKLKGTKKKDGILGLGGNDVLKGKKGKDGLCGGRGKDKLKGGPGKDKLDGGPGKDKEVQ
jgi:hemolysin type calcium-binding protein